jgi:nicotinamide mononucleotide (NMN) deamidase PncC
VTNVTEKDVAGVVASQLAQRELMLGTIECATGGAVGHQLFDTEEGPAVLGSSLNVQTVEDAVDLLDLPTEQFRSRGTFSAKAARAAARAGRDFLEVHWCLAVWAEPLPAEAMAVRETVYLALSTDQEVTDRTVHYDGSSDGMHTWLVEQALTFVHQKLQ